jgi:hypothetical protein
MIMRYSTEQKNLKIDEKKSADYFRILLTMINMATMIAEIPVAIGSPARVGTGAEPPVPGASVEATWATCPGCTFTELDQSLYPLSFMLTM